MDYTAIGNVVNIAARLCDKAEDGQILINQRASAEIEERAQFDPVGPIDLKGVGKQVETYNLIDLAAAAP
jgi:class 3 adenylate cyclase